MSGEKKFRWGPVNLTTTGGVVSNDYMLSVDVSAWSKALCQLTVLAASGTNPTLDLKMVDGPENDSMFFDDTPDGAFDQMTGSGKKRVVITDFMQFLNYAYEIGGTDTPKFTIILDVCGRD